MNFPALTVILLAAPLLMTRLHEVRCGTYSILTTHTHRNIRICNSQCLTNISVFLIHSTLSHVWQDLLILAIEDSSATLGLKLKLTIH